MESLELSKTFSLYNSIQKYVEKECENMFSLAEGLAKEKQEKLYLLPYHLNVIDELHINENAHSRILTKLLLYRSENGKYEFLESIIDYIVKTKYIESFREITVKEPIITQEEERIDLWVRDKDYAIIFENKVYNAADQEAQISRYIEKTKNWDYTTKTIFIVYLSQRGSEPSEQTWGTYKKEFEDRYINLSFRYEILSWLRTSVIPCIKPKDTYLQNAIAQYVDYLEGFFGLREIDKKYNMELQNFISDNLNLQSCKNEKERYDKLTQCINNFNDVKEQMDQMRVSNLPQIAAEWRSEIEKKYPQVEFYNLKNEFCLGLCVKKKWSGRNILLYIGYDGRDGHKELFCQSQFEDNLPAEDRAIEKTPIMELKNIISEASQWDCVWKYYPKDDLDGVFECFKQALEELLKLK